MTDERYEPTKAEFLADLLQGSAAYGSSMATLQRSHGKQKGQSEIGLNA